MTKYSISQITESFKKRGYDLINTPFGNRLIMMPPTSVSYCWESFESAEHISEEIEKHGGTPESFLDWYETEIKKPKESFYSQSFKKL